jgi:hypothetical protein
VTVNSNWDVAPDNTSVIEITPTTVTKVLSYATGEDPATQVLATPANRLATTAAGLVSLNTDQAVPMRDITAITAPTVGDALNAAIVQAGGEWSISANVLTLLSKDGSVFETLTLGGFVATPATVPSTRVPG